MKNIENLRNEMPKVYAHGRRVGCMAALFGKKLGMTQEQCQALYIAGKEHDLGKLFISNEILEAPRKLTEEEKTEVNKHTSKPILAECEFSSELSKIVAEQHHMDSSAICLESQIIAICDVFDSLTAARAYNREVDGQIIKESHNGFDFGVALDIMQTDPRQDVLNKDLLSEFEELIRYAEPLEYY